MILIEKVFFIRFRLVLRIGHRLALRGQALHVFVFVRDLLAHEDGAIGCLLVAVFVLGHALFSHVFALFLGKRLEVCDGVGFLGVFGVHELLNLVLIGEFAQSFASSSVQCQFVAFGIEKMLAIGFWLLIGHQFVIWIVLQESSFWDFGFRHLMLFGLRLRFFLGFHPLDHRFEIRHKILLFR